MQAMILSQNYNTPVFDWLAMPLRELREWIATNNELVRNKQRK